MPKRGRSEVGDPNLGSRRVRVDSVVSLPPRVENEELCVSHPSLISFANSMAPKGMEGMNMRLVRKRRDGKKMRQDDEFDDDGCELIAREADKEWHAQKGCSEMNVDYFIGVRHKRSDLIQLFEVDGMYALRPFVRRRRIFDEERAGVLKDEQRTYAEQKADLLQTFGGKRQLRRLEKYQRDRITGEKVDEKAQVLVNEAAAEMRAKDAAEGIHHLKAETTESMAPPHDNHATTPEGAYPLEGLITSGELAALEQEAMSMIETCAEGSGSLENPGWKPLVWKALVQITSDKELSSAARMRRLQAAMHLHYLIALANSSKVIRRETRVQLMEDMAVDEGILRCLLERFSVPHSAETEKVAVRRKTQADTTRLIVYAIVMWVTANGFKNCGRLNELSEALGISFKLLLTYALQVGCKVGRKQDEKSISEYRLALKVPLSFPPVRKRQGRPQKRS